MEMFPYNDALNEEDKETEECLGFIQCLWDRCACREIEKQSRKWGGCGGRETEGEGNRNPQMWKYRLIRYVKKHTEMSALMLS